MGVLLTVLLAVVPPILFLVWILRYDRYEREPLGFVIRVFVLGCLTVVPAALIEGILIQLPIFGGEGIVPAALQSFLVISPVEEAVKYLVILLFVWRNRNFNEPNDGIVYAGTVSIGFALAENLFYVFENGLGVGIARAVTSIPGHTFTGVLMGYHLGRARFGESKTANMLLAFLIPWFLHGAYDTFALSGTGAGVLVIPMVILYFVLGIRYLKKGRKRSMEMWAGKTPAETAPAPKPSRGNRGCRRAVGIILLALSLLFWVLIAIGFLFGDNVDEYDPADVISGTLLITALPIALGITLIFTGKRVKAEA